MLVEQADSRRDSRQSRRRVIAPGPLRRRRVGDGGGGPVTETPGYAARPTDLLLRGLVSTVLTLTGSASVFSAVIVGILRFFLVVRRRCTCDVSTVDTMTRHGWPLSHPRLLDHQPAPVSRPSECLRSHDTQISQEDHSWD